MPEYRMKLTFGWGRTSTFFETFNYSSNTLTSVAPWVMDKIIRFTRRYTYDCGHLDKPLNPFLSSLEVTKIAWSKHMDLDPYQAFMKREIERTTELCKTDKMFVNGDYDSIPHVQNQRPLRYAQKRERQFYERRNKKRAEMSKNKGDIGHA